MKDCYVGDRKDFMKFDLALSLYDRLAGINSIAYIPMLVPGGNPGQDFGYDGRRKRLALHDFLMRYSQNQDAENRQVFSYRRFMQDQDIGFFPYLDRQYDEGESVRHRNRVNYFSGVPREWLDQAIILIDPCTGLQRDKNGLLIKPDRNVSDEYLLYSDLETLWSAVTLSSIILVFQYIRNTNKYDFQAFLERKVPFIDAYCSACQTPIWLICDATDFTPRNGGQGLISPSNGHDAVAMFAITRNESLHGEINVLFRDYCCTPGYSMSLCNS